MNEKSIVEQLQLTETMKAMDAQMKLVIDALQAKAAQLQRERTRPVPSRRHAETKPVAPIATQLHGFAQQLDAKVRAIASLLTPEQRDKLRAIAPGFVHAALANDADVVQLVQILLGGSPEAAAFCIAFYLPLLEQRFAS